MILKSALTAFGYELEGDAKLKIPEFHMHPKDLPAQQIPQEKKGDISDENSSDATRRTPEVFMLSMSQTLCCVPHLFRIYFMLTLL